MKKLLIMVIVGTLCLVGTTSDITRHNSLTFADNNTDGLYHIVGDGISLEKIYHEGDVELHIASECQHEKLKAIGVNCWGVISSHEHCPTEYRQRAYKCKKCECTIVIQQAILIESKGEKK